MTPGIGPATTRFRGPTTVFACMAGSMGVDGIASGDSLGQFNETLTLS
jgi:hypothetical protein